jgi:hypothetical protein
MLLLTSELTPVTGQESHKFHVGDLKFLPFKTSREELVIVGIFSGILVAVIVYFI